MNTSTQDFTFSPNGPYGVPGGSINPLAAASGYITEFVENTMFSLVNGPVDNSFEALSWSPPNTAQITIIPYNVAAMSLEPWKGMPRREEIQPHFKQYSLDRIWQNGAIFDYLKVVSGMPIPWTLAPQALGMGMQKKLSLEFGALIERVIATPQAVTNQPDLYDAWGYRWAKTNAAPNNPNNKFQPEYGSYYNLTYAQPLTAANLRAAGIRLTKRRGMDGTSLGLRPRYLIVHHERLTEAEELVKRLRLVPVPTGDPTVTTTYVTGDSAVLGQFEIITSLTMPVDTWIVAPDLAGFPDQMRPFITIKGLNRPSNRVDAGSGVLPALASGLQAGLNTDGAQRAMAGSLPEFWIEWHGTDSALFQMHKKVAVDGWVFNGIFLQDGRLLEICSERDAPV